MTRRKESLELWDDVFVTVVVSLWLRQWSPLSGRLVSLSNGQIRWLKDDEQRRWRSADIRAATANCTMLVRSSQHQRQGELVTPGYPRGYPSGLQCCWTFLMKKYERLRLLFLDFHVVGGPVESESTSVVFAHECMQVGGFLMRQLIAGNWFVQRVQQSTLSLK